MDTQKYHRRLLLMVGKHGTFYSQKIFFHKETTVLGKKSEAPFGVLKILLEEITTDIMTARIILTEALFQH